jgi:hypothetical protein
VPPQDNLFFALLAFESTDATDINRQGQAIYAAYSARRTDDPTIRLTFDNALPRARQAFAGERSVLCGGRGKPEDCIQRAIAHPEDLRRLISDNQLFLNRYGGVAGYQRLEDPVPQSINSPMASWTPFMLGKRLFLTDIALQIAAGRVDQAIALLGPDIAFTRRLLAQQDITVLDKMVLAASLVDSLELVSDLIRTHSLSDSQYLQLSTTLGPLTDAERSFVGPMLRDFDFFAATIKDLKNRKNTPRLVSSSPSAGSAAAGELSSHFIKLDSTLNVQWQLLAQKIALSRNSCTKFLSGAEKFKSHTAATVGGLVYNPIGNMLSGIAASTGIEHIHAMCDLEGMVRIVALELQVRLQHVDDARFAQFASDGGARYANPFTAQPMRIDLARKTIDFQPVAERDRTFFPWPLAATP